MEILVGVDGRDESRPAVGLAVELAKALGADVAAAAVLDYNPVPIDVHPYEEALREHFDRMLAAARDAAGGFPLSEHRLTDSSPARGLAALGTELDAALIVVGSTRRGKIGRVLPGASADSLLTAGDRPVVVAPLPAPDAERRAIKRIGVAYDGGPESRLALEFALDWAKRLGASLRLIAVVPNPGPYIAEVISPVAYENSVRERLQADLAEAAGSIEAVDVETKLETGNPRRLLQDETESVDLLVLGSRGYGPLGRVLLGSVARSVIHDAACPVVVVPRGTVDRPGSSRADGETVTA